MKDERKQTESKKTLTKAELGMIENCNPRDVEDDYPVNKPVFLFARKVKTMHGDTENLSKYRYLVDAFVARWKNELVEHFVNCVRGQRLSDLEIESWNQDPLEDIWPMFVKGFRGAKISDLTETMVKASKLELPEPWCMYYEAPHIQLLAKACIQLQKEAGEFEPFEMAQSLAGRIMGRCPSTAHDILFMFVEDKFLKLHKQGRRHVAGNAGGRSNQYFCCVEVI